MREINYEMLKAKREKVLNTRAKTEEEQKAHIGFGYVQIIDGRAYPIMACFPTESNAGEAKDKLTYLIRGRKS